MILPLNKQGKNNQSLLQQKMIDPLTSILKL